MVKKSKAAPKGPRAKPKTKANAPGAGPAMPAGNNMAKTLSDDEQRALFLRDKDALKSARAKVRSATAEVRNVCKRIKSDGFKVLQVEVAIALENEHGEAEQRAEIAMRLQAAKWLGLALGHQLSLFGEPDRTPAVDRAFEDGKTAGLEGQRRQPPYSPEVPQHDAWMNGYYEGQEALGRKGFKAPAPKVPPVGDDFPATSGEA